MNKPIVWSISSVNPAGCSGIDVDLETLTNLNVASRSITTVITGQHDHKLIPSDYVAEQCSHLQSVFKPNAIKIGMLGSPATHEKIAYFLNGYQGPVVFDPLLLSSSETSKKTLTSLVTLLPFADVVTPNLFEAEALLNRSLTTYEDIQEGALGILSLGAKSVLLKGGHVKDALFSQDYWTDGHHSFWIANKRLPNKNTQGKGCAYSSALAACLALGYSIKDAIVIAKMYVNRGIRNALSIDKHSAKLFHNGWPEDELDLPYLSSSPLSKPPIPFKRCEIGLYPIVDSSHWLEQLLPLGVKCIQLRIKNTQTSIVENEVKRCVFLAKKYAASLFINDYWQLAIRFGADGIHLGQDDLPEADIDAIHQAGLYLGVSTHCYSEVAIAHALNPSYIACGPIYPTTSKVISSQPQGIEQLQRWRRTLHYPLVAIGGINFDRLPEILNSGVDGVSLISAITKASDPLVAAQQFLTKINMKQSP